MKTEHTKTPWNQLDVVTVLDRAVETIWSLIRRLPKRQQDIRKTFGEQLVIAAIGTARHTILESFEASAVLAHDTHPDCLGRFEDCERPTCVSARAALQLAEGKP